MSWSRPEISCLTHTTSVLQTLLKMMDGCSKALVQTLDGVFSFSEMELTGTPELNLETVDVTQLVEDLRHLVATQLKRGVEVIFNVPPGLKALSGLRGLREILVARKLAW